MIETRRLKNAVIFTQTFTNEESFLLLDSLLPNCLFGVDVATVGAILS